MVLYHGTIETSFENMGHLVLYHLKGNFINYTKIVMGWAKGEKYGYLK